MAEGRDKEDQTEEASERRIEQALERGDVPRSQDLSRFLVLACGLATSALMLQTTGPELVRALAGLLAQSDARRIGGVAVMDAIQALGWAMAGPMLAVVIAAIVGGMALHRPMIVTEPLMPKASRINPMSGFKRLMGAKNLVQFGKTLAKLAAVIGVLGAVLWPERAAVLRLTLLDATAGMIEAGRLAGRLIVTVLVLYAGIAAFDAVYQYFAWKKRLRMSLKEVKDENKETGGNPEIKARLRAIRNQRMRQRMIAAVPKATVILVNPTHYAVALRYDKGMAAPRCVAKGVDDLALKIREIAREHRIAIIENPPLARALHASVDIDEDIPPEHYKAVAEIVGFVLGARRRAGTNG